MSSVDLYVGVPVDLLKHGFEPIVDTCRLELLTFYCSSPAFERSMIRREYIATLREDEKKKNEKLTDLWNAEIKRYEQENPLPAFPPTLTKAQKQKLSLRRKEKRRHIFKFEKQLLQKEQNVVTEMVSLTRHLKDLDGTYTKDRWLSNLILSSAVSLDAEEYKREMSLILDDDPKLKNEGDYELFSLGDPNNAGKYQGRPFATFAIRALSYSYQEVQALIKTHTISEVNGVFTNPRQDLAKLSEHEKRLVMIHYLIEVYGAVCRLKDTLTRCSPSIRQESILRQASLVSSAPESAESLETPGESDKPIPRQDSMLEPGQSEVIFKEFRKQIEGLFTSYKQPTRAPLDAPKANSASKTLTKEPTYVHSKKLAEEIFERINVCYQQMNKFLAALEANDSVSEVTEKIAIVDLKEKELKSAPLLKEATKHSSHSFIEGRRFDSTRIRREDSDLRASGNGSGIISGARGDERNRSDLSKKRFEYLKALSEARDIFKLIHELIVSPTKGE